MSLCSSRKLKIALSEATTTTTESTLFDVRTSGKMARMLLAANHSELRASGEQQSRHVCHERRQTRDINSHFGSCEAEWRRSGLLHGLIERDAFRLLAARPSSPKSSLWRGQVAVTRRVLRSLAELRAPDGFRALRTRQQSKSGRAKVAWLAAG